MKKHLASFPKNIEIPAEGGGGRENENIYDII